MNIVIKEIKFGSAEWEEARKIRYALFFEMHGLDEEVMDDDKEASAQHFSIIEKEDVLAYLRLSKQLHNYSVSQMVVRSDQQSKGFGKLLMQYVLKNIVKGHRVTLNARLTSHKFYEKLGFEISGMEFCSSTTGVVHCPMMLESNI